MPDTGITFDQFFMMGLLAVVLVFFVWGRLRYDVVAFSALMLAVLAGVVDPGSTFSGFGHPATVTVAMVLIISRGLSNSGAVELMAKHLIPPMKSTTAHVGLLAGVGGGLSAMMNNVGALALLMPAALQSAAKVKRAAALLLMPLAFGSILGGLITMIGTPPNIIIANFREQNSGEAFGMFDFTPVGVVVAVAGILFVSIIGWRLIPKARSEVDSATPLFEIENYVAELIVPEDSDAIGKPLREIDGIAGGHEAMVLSLVRNGYRIDRPRHSDELQAGDRLIVETGSEGLDGLLKELDLKPEGASHSYADLMDSSELAVVEAVVQPRSRMVGRTAAALGLRDRYGVVLLAVSREGRPHRDRLNRFRFRSGDVLLLADDAGHAAEAAVELGCLPLAARETGIGGSTRAWLSIGLFAAAIVAATVGLLTIPVALSLVAGVMVILNIVPPRQIYESVDWPVVVLLGAMIPVGAAVTSTGVSALIAGSLLAVTEGLPVVVLLTLVLIVTMTLSDVINNAATAIVMAPIGIEIAERLNVNSDAFLMAVAIGASAAFLTPIGHQNNALVMGPGGYRFGDYWRMGLPLEIIIVAVAVPMLLIVWPL